MLLFQKKWLHVVISKYIFFSFISEEYEALTCRLSLLKEYFDILKNGTF